MSDITVVSTEKYLASPCAALPLPYSVCGGKAVGARHLGGPSGAPAAVPEGAFSRLLHPLGDMKRFESGEYSVRQLFLEDDDDAALVSRLAEMCGEKPDIASFVKQPYYNERLCVAVHSRKTGECVCAGLGGADGSLREAWTSLILIPEGLVGGEASKLLISELLRRMAPIAGFATANAPYGSNLERLLRRCGFSGGDIWFFYGNRQASRI